MIKKAHRVIFYLMILLLPTQLGYHFWPEWSMILGRRVDYLSPTIYLTDILVGLLMIFWGTGKILTFRPLSGRQISNLKINFKKLLVPILFTVFIIANIFQSVNPAAAIFAWIKLAEFLLLGLYIIKTKPDKYLVGLFLSLAVFYESAIAIAQFADQSSLGGIFWYLGERTFTSGTPGIAQFNLCLTPSGCREILRPYGTFPHPNLLSGFIVVGLVYMGEKLKYIFPVKLNTKKSFTSKQKAFRISGIFYYLYLAVALTALILTFSRLAWSVLLLVLFSQTFNKRDKFHVKQYIRGFKISELFQKKLPVFLSGILFLILGFSIEVINILADFYPASESVVIRERLNTSAISVWIHSPFLGVGLGNFLNNLPGFLVERSVYFLQPVHNIYLLTLSEIGILGVAIVIYIIFLILKHESGIMNHEKSKRNWDLKFNIHASLFTILFIGMFDHYPLTLQQGQLLLTLLAGLVLY